MLWKEEASLITMSYFASVYRSNGFGTAFALDDGSTWVGEWQDGLFHGKNNTYIYPG